jgi:DMSO/TMAO reductase YedYZ molybdopterin-dependent catalytic subunit
LRQEKVSAKDHSGATAAYSGVSLAEILRPGEIKFGKDLKGPLLTYVLIQAADGYRVLFSVAEVDPSMSANVVLVANRKNDKPLDAKEGPYRLVVPGDKRFARWVRQVTRISVKLDGTAP